MTNPLVRNAAVTGHATRPGRVTVACIVALIAVACGDSPLSPPGQSEDRPLELGRHVSGTFDSARFSDTLYYRVAAGRSASLRIESDPPGLLVSVRDMSGGELTYAYNAFANSAGAVLPASADDRVVMLIVRDGRTEAGRAEGMSWRVSLEPLDTAPEGGTDLLTYGQTISGTLVAPMDVDVYRLDVAPGDSFTAFLRILDHHDVLAAVHAGDTVKASLAATGPHAVNRGVPLQGVRAAGDAYTLAIENQGVIAPGESVRYAVQIMRLPEPDHSLDPLPFNTVVEAALSPYGEMERYSFTPDSADMVRLYVVADSASGIGGSIINDDGVHVEALHYDTSSEAWVTQPFVTTPRSYQVEVWHDPTFNVDSLPFSIRLFRADRNPETLPAALARDVMLTGEGIETAGDVDEFTFTLSDSSFVSALRMRDGDPWEFTGSILTSDGQAVEASEGVSGEGGMELAAVLPAGSYRYRVAPGGTFTGPYSFVFASASYLPEDVPPALAVGDTVTESMELLHDGDEFTLTLTGTERVRFGVHNGAAVTGGELWLVNLDRMGTYAYSPAGASDFSFSQVPGLAGPGTYRLAANTARAGAAWDTRGSYRVAVLHVDTLLEAGAQALAVGDSSTVEAIDHDGDVDRFRIVGAAGTAVRIQLEGERAGVTVQVFDASANRWTPEFNNSHYVTTDAVTFPSSGELTVDVMQQCASTLNCSTPLDYILRVLPQ